MSPVVPLPIHPYLLGKRRCRRASYSLLQSSEVLHSVSDIDSTNPSANSSQTLSSFSALLPSVRSSSYPHPPQFIICLHFLLTTSLPFADVTMSESTQPLFASLASNTVTPSVRSVRTVVASVLSTCSSSSVPLSTKSSAADASYSINRRDRHLWLSLSGMEKMTSEIDFLS